MNVVALRQPDYEFNIDADFEDLLSPLPESSLTGLEQDIIENGCRNPLVIWEEENILLDGHHRYSICSKHKIPYKVDRLNFENKEAAKRWIIEHQATQRRNLAPKELSYLRGQYYESVKGERGAPLGNKNRSKQSVQNGHFVSEQGIRDLVAEKFGVGNGTIHRDKELFKAITSISQHLGKEARFTLTSSETKLNREQIKHLGIIFDTEPTAGEECYQTLIHDPDSQRKASQVLQQYESMANRNLELAQKEEDHLEYDESEDDPFEPSEIMSSNNDNQNVEPPTKKVPQKPEIEPEPPVEKEPLELIPELPAEYLEEVSTADGKTLYIKHTPQTKATFNTTNESIDWAFWSWNPISGCWHGCNYCYARDIANRFWKDVGFEPTFYPDRLNAPANTKAMPEHKIIKEAEKRNLDLEFAKIQATNVFTGSMADIFGKWVPQEWIMQIFQIVKQNPQWNFLFLTKFPQRLQEINDILGGFPENVWVGTTVDTQARVKVAEKAFKNISAKVKWLSCEPMMERLTFKDLSGFDLVVIGGASKSSQTDAFQPEWEWVYHLTKQAYDTNCSVYWKENLTVRPKEFPLL